MLAKAGRQLATRQRHSARKLTWKWYFFLTDSFSQIILNCERGRDPLEFILSYIWRGLKGALFYFIKVFWPRALILLPLPREHHLCPAQLGQYCKGLREGTPKATGWTKDASGSSHPVFLLPVKWKLHLPWYPIPLVRMYLPHIANNIGQLGPLPGWTPTMWELQVFTFCSDGFIRLESGLVMIELCAPAHSSASPWDTSLLNASTWSSCVSQPCSSLTPSLVLFIQEHFVTPLISVFSSFLSF